MKKLLLALSFLVAFGSMAQITLNRSHIVVSGQKIIQAEDTAKFALAASGTNMNWDFSNLQSVNIDSIHWGLPFWYEGYQNFPTANIAYKEYGNDSNVFYMLIDETQIKVIGFYSYTDSSQEVFNFNSKILGFPATYNSNFDETETVKGDPIAIGVDPDSTGPIPFIDSVRINFDRRSISNIDGWGNLKTPLGTFPALKQTILEITSQAADMHTNGNWLSIPNSLLIILNLPIPEPDSSYSVNFWTNTGTVGFPLISYSYDVGEDSADGVSWLMAKPSASSLNYNVNSNVTIYPNPVSSLLKIETNKNTKAQLYDFNGRLLIQTEFANSGELDLSILSEGIYLIKIFDNSNGELIHTKTIIKR
jgi:hypothetical protein